MECRQGCWVGHKKGKAYRERVGLNYAKSEDGWGWGVDMIKVKGFWGFGMVGVRAKECPVSGAWV